MLKGRFWIACVCCLLSAGGALASHSVRIGVLAFQDKATTLAQWQPTAVRLAQNIANTEFQLIPLTYEELDIEVERQRLDFVLTNPEHYVVLRNRYKLRPMATINQRIGEQVVDEFGSVILTRTDGPVQDFSDVRGKRVAAVGLNSLGGYLMAADTLANQGIELSDPKAVNLSFLGVPHSRVVKAVLANEADVGIVRTGVLEQMVSAGQLDLTQIRVLNQQPAQRFPQLLSTDLYPEWPWAAMPQTSNDLTKAVLVILLQIPPDSPAAIAGRYQGFSVPANYTSVEELMRRMHAYPGLPEEDLWESLWERHERLIKIALAFSAIAMLLVLLKVWRSNVHLRELTRLSRANQSDLEITAAAFNSQVGLIVTDELTRIQRANSAMTWVLGYQPDELLGQVTSILRGSAVEDGTLRSLWHEVKNHGRWQGELWCRHKLGHNVPCMVSISAVNNKAIGLSGFVGSFTDISAQKTAQDDIRKLAYFDHLTQLPNRRNFMDTLTRTMRDCLDQGHLASVMFIDLDHFKDLNDAHGHIIGDELLRRLARRLEFLIGPSDMAARLGGDEFVVMMGKLDGGENHAMSQTMALAQRVHHALLDPFDFQTTNDPDPQNQILRYSCSGSIGVALFGMVEEPLTEVLKRADVAMYKSKQDGRNVIRQYDPQAQRLLNERMALSNDLNLALRDGQLFLLYQPQVNAHNLTVGAECLMRWQHPVRGLVSPAEFIPLAEDSGAIVAMGYWVVQSACDTLVRWATMPTLCELSLSVNVSPRQFNDPGFVTRVTHILQQTGARPQLLRLEVTEGVMMQDPQKVVAQMHELCAMGLTFSVDDFGTGYSSLSYIQKLPLAELKIDKAFVSDMTTNQRSEAIVKAIIALGRSMGGVIVSEGVETEEQRERLLALGCNLIQGFLVARPMACAALEHQVTQGEWPGAPRAPGQIG
jgi:diguanylate cyclase (GGDEF)-like protein/PAS domain S-box-containing protein